MENNSDNQKSPPSAGDISQPEEPSQASDHGVPSGQNAPGLESESSGMAQGANLNNPPSESKVEGATEQKEDPQAPEEPTEEEVREFERQKELELQKKKEEDLNRKKWFIYFFDHHEGPFSSVEIITFIRKGRVSQNNFIWKMGFSDWTKLSEVEEIQAMLFGKLNDQGKSHPGSSMSDDELNLFQDDSVDESKAVWTLNSNGIHYGPLSMAEIIYRILRKEVNEFDYIWKEGWTGWKHVKGVGVYKNNFESALEMGPQSYAIKYDIDSRPLISKNSDSASALPAINLNEVKEVEFPAKTQKEKLEDKLEGFLATEQGEKVKTLASKLNSYAGLIKDKIKASDQDLTGDEDASRIIDIALEKAKEKKRKRKFYAYVFLTVALVAGTFIAVPIIKEAIEPPFEIAEGMTESDYRMHLKQALSSVRNGANMHITTDYDPLNPWFYISSNLPSGTWLEITLEGEPNNLIGVKEYKKKVEVELKKQFAKVRFSPVGMPLPPGKYKVFIAVHPEQSKETEALVKKMNAFLSVHTDRVFIPGDSKEPFQKLLKEYLESVGAGETSIGSTTDQKTDEQSLEVQQMVGTLSAGWEEVAFAFEDLTKGKVALSKWNETRDLWKPIFAKLKDEALKVNPQNQSDFRYWKVYKGTAVLMEKLEDRFTKIDDWVQKTLPVLVQNKQSLTEEASLEGKSVEDWITSDIKSTDVSGDPALKEPKKFLKEIEAGITKLIQLVGE